MITEKERIILRLDTIFLCNYKNTIYKKVFTDFLEAHKKIFFIIYSSYHSRFLKLFPKPLQNQFDKMFFINSYRNFIDYLNLFNEGKQDYFYDMCFESAKKEKADLIRLVKQDKQGLKTKELKRIFEEKYLREYVNKIKIVFVYDKKLNDYNDNEIVIKQEYDNLIDYVFYSIDSWINLIEIYKIVFLNKETDIDEKLKTLKEFQILNNLDLVDPLARKKEDYESLFLLLNKRQTNIKEATKKGFKEKSIDPQSEKKAVYRFNLDIKDYLKEKLNFDKEMIEQLKQLIK